MAGVADSPPASYGRAVAAPAGGRWLQYWRWHESNRQDRGVLRTGRHAGDWELVQVRVDRGEQPVEAVYAQHSGGERCGWPEVRTRGDAPVGLPRQRLARGLLPPRGARPHVPRSQRRGARARQRDPPAAGGDRRADSPSWMRFTGRWGASRARLPFEQSSPRGPAFQGVRWRDPAAFAASARSCMAGRCDEVGECDWRESALARRRGGRRRRDAGRRRRVAAAPASLGGGDAPAAVLAAGSHATLLHPGAGRGGSGRAVPPAPRASPVVTGGIARRCAVTHLGVRLGPRSHG